MVAPSCAYHLDQINRFIVLWTSIINAMPSLRQFESLFTEQVGRTGGPKVIRTLGPEDWMLR